MRYCCCSPRVVGTERADFYSLEAILASPQFAGKQGEALALAIYDYFTSAVDGTYHFWSADENDGRPFQRRLVYDPVKYLNVYGWLVCGNMSNTLYGLYRAAGFKARQIGVPGHSLCEVFYEGRWHILDVDMWTWFRTPLGHIASAFELAKHPQALIIDNPNKSNPCDLPDRTLKDYAQMYAQAETVDGEERVKGVCPHWAIRAHTMDFRLRPGETLARSQNEHGRFVMGQSWKDNMKTYAREWHGFPRERYAPFRTYGNGRWTYAPNLSAAYVDFERGLWERQGLTQDPNGLVGSGSATFRIQSPYPFCGIPDWSGEKITWHDGVWLEAKGEGAVRGEVSTAEDKWQTVFDTNGRCAERCDITPLLASRYDCLLRFSLGAGARLNSFNFDGYLMTAPGSLPRLVEGPNTMELRCLDKHHLCTVPWSQVIDFRMSADVRAQAESLENAEPKPYQPGWQMLAQADDARPVRAAFRFGAPAGRTFAWIYAIASAREGPENQPPRSALLEWSLDGSNWAPLSGLRLNNTHLQWDCSIDGEIVFSQPVRAVWLRISSGTALSGFEFYGHLDEGRPEGEALQITHRWSETDGEHMHRAPDGAERYQIMCGKNPVGHSIEMHAPSRPQ